MTTKTFADVDNVLRKLQQTFVTYPFRKWDPVIDELFVLVNKEAARRGIDVGEMIRIACKKSKVSVGAARGWFYHGTRRPQYATIEAFARGLGYSKPQFTRWKR